jgi:hypothetical protein
LAHGEDLAGARLRPGTEAGKSVMAAGGFRLPVITSFLGF